MIVLGDWIWSYVGGVGYVVHEVESDSWIIMNGSVSGASFPGTTEEQEPYRLEFTQQVPSGKPPLGSRVRHLLTGELWIVGGYLTSSPYQTTLMFLQGSDRQATCYTNEAVSIDYD